MPRSFTDTNDINREEWNALVNTASTGTWFQSPDAYGFFLSLPKLFRPFAVGVVHNERLRGICVGYVTVERNPIKQFFTRRAIILGGPALADDATEEEVRMLMTAVKRCLSTPSAVHSARLATPIYIETRNFNDYSWWRGAFETAGFAYQPHLNFHVDTNSATMDETLSDNRKRQLKKAQSAVTISEAQSEQEIHEWYDILRNLYLTKVKTPLFPVDFFLQFYHMQLGKILLVKYDGKIIGGSMIAAQTGKCLYEWFECGLNTDYREFYPSVMATYAGMRYAYEHGFARYDMMGAGEPDKPYGVRDFKAEFGGKLVEQGRFLYVANSILYRIGAIGVALMKRRR